MNTRSGIVVGGIAVEVIRKPIKNLHVGVYPPGGRVRIAVPPGVSDEAVKLAVISRLGWIRRQRARFDAQPRQSRREMVSGESHYVWGRRYRLEVNAGKPGVRVGAKLVVDVSRGATVEQRLGVLLNWYRRELKARIPGLLEKWEPIVGVQAKAWGVKRMRTMWGSCNPKTRRIWVNLELAKKAPQCLEYILVHELVHIRCRRHDADFIAAMDQCLPRWRHLRQVLGTAPLAAEDWGC